MTCVAVDGWSRRGRGMPLGHRLDATGVPWPARHCWVDGGADGRGLPRPGVLLEWRHTAQGWEGRVVYAAHLRPGAWTLVEEWLPGALLRVRGDEPEEGETGGDDTGTEPHK